MALACRYKESINAAPGTIRVIRKEEVQPAMLKALKVDEWPVWANKTGGWPDLNHAYEYEHPVKVGLSCVIRAVIMQVISAVACAYARP